LYSPVDSIDALSQDWWVAIPQTQIQNCVFYRSKGNYTVPLEATLGFIAFLGVAYLYIAIWSRLMLKTTGGGGQIHQTVFPRLNNLTNTTQKKGVNILQRHYNGIAETERQIKKKKKKNLPKKCKKIQKQWVFSQTFFNSHLVEQFAIFN